MACVLLVAAFFVSMRWGISFEVWRGVDLIDLRSGCIVARWDNCSDQKASDWAVFREPSDISWLSKTRWRIDYSNNSVGNSGTTFVRIFQLPLWLPFILVAIPTAILWNRDRRPPEGHCQQCGYNLPGNTSGVCPDCGAAKPSAVEESPLPK